MSVETNLSDTISALSAALKGYADALEADSANPLASYSLDGENVTRNEWRAGLMKQIADGAAQIAVLTERLNQQSPWMISTRVSV